MPSASRMYRAVAARDAAFRGTFVFGVVTTGVFCHPGCGARTPRRENCIFFESASAAEGAGMRPCRKCRPLDDATPPRCVTRLVARVAADPADRIPDAELREMGIDPSTARRAFLREKGATFRAYQRAERLRRAAADIDRGTSVTVAAVASGFHSQSGFGAAFRRMFGAPPSRAEVTRALVAERFPTPLGALVGVADESGVWLLDFEDRPGFERVLAKVRGDQGAVAPGTNAVLRTLDRELREYFAGVPARSAFRFSTPIHLSGTPFQIRIWESLRRIPAGTTRSYAELAAAAGLPGRARAAGLACGQNRLLILVPCHRAVRSDGTPCGYSGGVWRKKRLLALEARATAQPAVIGGGGARRSRA